METLKLEYNHNTDMYEAMEDGHHVEVNPDVFAETRTDMIQDLVKEGMGEDDAYNQADDELLKVVSWTGSLPMDGVYIDGVYQGYQGE